MICSARHGLEMSGRRRVRFQIPPRFQVFRGSGFSERASGKAGALSLSEIIPIRLLALLKFIKRHFFKINRGDRYASRQTFMIRILLSC